MKHIFMYISIVLLVVLSFFIPKFWMLPTLIISLIVIEMYCNKKIIDIVKIP